MIRRLLILLADWRLDWLRFRAHWHREQVVNHVFAAQRLDRLAQEAYADLTVLEQGAGTFRRGR